MSDALRGLQPSMGWSVMHLFYRVDRRRWRGLAAAERAGAIDEFSTWLAARAQEDGLQLIPFAGVTKFDVGFMAIHPDLWRVQQLSQEIVATTLGACFKPVYSFLSLTEASE